MGGPDTRGRVERARVYSPGNRIGIGPVGRPSRGSPECEVLEHVQVALRDLDRVPAAAAHAHPQRVLVVQDGEGEKHARHLVRRRFLAGDLRGRPSENTPRDGVLRERETDRGRAFRSQGERERERER